MKKVFLLFLLFGIYPCFAMELQEILAKYGSVHPTQWSETTTGVKTRIETDEKIIALTMDAQKQIAWMKI